MESDKMLNAHAHRRKMNNSSKGHRRLEEAAVSDHVRIASHLLQSDVETWAIPFHVLASTGQNKHDGIRRIAHPAIYQTTVESDLLPDEIIEKALIDSIPQFFAARAQARRTGDRVNAAGGRARLHERRTPNSVGLPGHGE
jgi:hypothetical protein